MKLAQGQVWHVGSEYLRIVTWERLAIAYKSTPSPLTKDGTLVHVTKKEFCRLIKGGVLHQPDAPEVGQS